MEHLKVTDNRFGQLTKKYPNFDNSQIVKSSRAQKQFKKTNYASPAMNKKLKFLHLKADSPLNHSSKLRDKFKSFRHSSKSYLEQMNEEANDNKLPQINMSNDFDKEDSNPFLFGYSKNDAINKQLKRTHQNENQQKSQLLKINGQLDNVNDNYQFLNKKSKIKKDEIKMYEENVTSKLIENQVNEQIEENFPYPLENSISEVIDEAVNKYKDITKLVQHNDKIQLKRMDDSN